MVAALALAFLLAAVCVFVFGFVLVEESGGARSAVPGVDRFRDWLSTSGVPRAAHAWLRLRRALAGAARGVARATFELRDRRRLAVEVRRRSRQAGAGTARVRFD